MLLEPGGPSAPGGPNAPGGPKAPGGPRGLIGPPFGGVPTPPPGGPSEYDGLGAVCICCMPYLSILIFSELQSEIQRAISSLRWISYLLVTRLLTLYFYLIP